MEILKDSEVRSHEVYFLFQKYFAIIPAARRRCCDSVQSMGEYFVLCTVRRLRATSTIVLADCQNQRYFIPLPCWRMELSGGRTRWVRFGMRITKRSHPNGWLLFGDPYGNRTHVTAVKGRCLNRLTNGPGSGNLTRTDDTPGMNRMLYQLSYAAIFLLCLTARDIISAKKRFVNNFCSVFSRFQKVFSASSTNSPKTPSRQGPVTRTQRI